MGKIVGLIVVVIAVIAGFMLFGKDTDEKTTPPTPTLPAPAAKKETAPTVAKGEVKEFTTTAYYDEAGVWYSLKEMRVKKGDMVRVKATNTKGMHDFVIDELGVKKELPLNEEVVIEFTADKSGEFVYYCSKPGHRAKGQWGKLIVE